MIRKFLTSKYGEFVTNRMMTHNNEVILHHSNKEGTDEQTAVFNHIRTLVTSDSVIAQEKLEKVKWGMDFSSWLGPFGLRKDFMFIGAEPHISNNFQLVYDFGQRNKYGADIRANALAYAKNDKDIWHYLVQNFVSDPDEDDLIVQFLLNSYITDLCHIVPKGCGQVSKIAQQLNIKVSDWRKFRSSIAKRFLTEEIDVVDPKIIVLHGAVARNFFSKEMSVQWHGREEIADYKRRSVLYSSLNGRKVIAIPHLKGQILNELWRSKNQIRRDSIRTIIQDLIS